MTYLLITAGNDGNFFNLLIKYIK